MSTATAASKSDDLADTANKRHQTDLLFPTRHVIFPQLTDFRNR